ncbi:hypothetical protein JHK84_040628 [Glycine max]|nr:hypothetical protein JHK84_040628 [Glycine max]
MARDMLAILIFTLASESVFSTKGRVLDPNCCSLTPQMMETLVCTQDWIKRTPSPLPSNENEEFLEFEIIEEESNNQYGDLANLVIPSCRPVKVWQKLQVYARGNDVNLTDYKGKVLAYLNDIYVHVLTMLDLSTKCRVILKSNCYHKEGHQTPCKYGEEVYMMLLD